MKSFKNMMEQLIEGAEKGDGAEYKAFFNKTLKKYGVNEPDKLSADDKKKFFDEIDAGWEGDSEED